MVNKGSILFGGEPHSFGVRRLGFGFVMLSVLLSAGCASFPFKASSKIPITLEGDMSTVVLSMVKRQNIIREGERTYTHPDGLVFYFVVYPAYRSYSYPTIREYQNFTIDGIGYWQNTNGTIDSYTVIYNEKTFKENEPEVFAKSGLRRNSGALIQKTIICGDPLPEQGIINYKFFFGFEQELEEFDFIFRIQDIL
jgi:hypothetical protein